MLQLFIILIACLLTACSSNPPKTSLTGIQIVADSDANQGGKLSTSIDIVFVYDVTTLGQLAKSGPEWFERKNALMNNLATSIDVVHLEIPPDKAVDVPLPSRASKAIGVYSFANYLSSGGQSMGTLTPFKKMTIRLTADNVVYAGT